MCTTAAYIICALSSWNIDSMFLMMGYRNIQPLLQRTLDDLFNVYGRLEVQLDVHGFICIIYSSLFLLYMFRLLFAPILRSTNCRVQP
jgi:hypothetical protein